MIDVNGRKQRVLPSAGYFARNSVLVGPDHRPAVPGIAVLPQLWPRISRQFASSSDAASYLLVSGTSSVRIVIYVYFHYYRSFPEFICQRFLL